jgi:hypothetical protein
MRLTMPCGTDPVKARHTSPDARRRLHEAGVSLVVDTGRAWWLPLTFGACALVREGATCLVGEAPAQARNSSDGHPVTGTVLHTDGDKSSTRWRGRRQGHVDGTLSGPRATATWTLLPIHAVDQLLVTFGTVNARRAAIHRPTDNPNNDRKEGSMKRPSAFEP